MYVSRPRVISQGLIKFYTVEDRENFGDQDKHRGTPSHRPHTPKYTTYVIDYVPDRLIALPLDHIADKLSSGG